MHILKRTQLSQPMQFKNKLTFSFAENGFIFLLLITFISCKGSEQISTTNKNQPDTNLNELEELYWAKIDSSKMNFTKADVEFMTGMIGHHAQALIMSDLAPKNGASPAVQTLAARIINAQKDEIATMQTWLRDRGQPVPEVHIEGLNLMIHGMEGGHGGHMDHSNMPGMLTQNQLVELSEAKGKEFDRLFLTYMIQHHQGAITMVQKLINTDGAVQDEQAFRLSTDINVDQITEIERMKLMLSQLGESQ